MKNQNHVEAEGHDLYIAVFSGYFHTTFEISTFLLNQFVGSNLLFTIALRVSEDKVSS